MSIQDGGIVNVFSGGFCGLYKDFICQFFGLNVTDVFSFLLLHTLKLKGPFNFTYFELHENCQASKEINRSYKSRNQCSTNFCP